MTRVYSLLALKRLYLQRHWPASRPVRSRGRFVCHVVAEESEAKKKKFLNKCQNEGLDDMVGFPIDFQTR